VPKLWALIAGVQEAHFGPLYDSGWDRSYLFLLACYFIYPILKIPNFLYRVVILERGSRAISPHDERAILGSTMLSSKDDQWPLLLSWLPSPLYYKIFEKKLNGSIVLWVAGFQVTYTILQPLLSQPRGKHLTPMGAGETRDAIHELATTAAFPIKEIYVTEGVLHGVQTGVQAWGWPRKTYITVHKETLEQYTTNDITALLA
jgi:hypothetical protein